MPESQNTSGSESWQIRRDGKVYAVDSNELLLKIHREGRFTGLEEIRQKGEGSWGSISSFNFQKLGQGSTESSQRPARSEVSKTTSNEPVAEPLSKNQESNWWKEDKTAAGNSTPFRTKLAAVVALMGLGLVVLGGGLIYLFLLPPDTNSNSIIAQVIRSQPSSEPGSVSETGTSSTPVPDDLKPTQNKQNKSNQKLDSNDGPKPDDKPVSSEPTANETPINLAKVESSGPPRNSANSEISMNITKDESDAGIVAAKEPEKVKPENKPEEKMTPAAPVKQIGGKEVIVVEREQSPSAIVDQKSIADKAYDLIEAKISFYKKTNENIQANRTGWIEARKKVELLEAYIKENKLKYDQADARVAELNASLANPAGLISQLQQKINQERLERNQLNALLPRLVLDTENKKRQWQTEQNTMLQSEKEFIETCKKEKESLDGMMQSIDFFAELPFEVHKRILEQAQNWNASEPDFFISYLLHSAAAIWTEDHQTPLRNLNEMRRQAGLLSLAEREARKHALQRFETIGIGLVGLSKFKQKKTTDAIETLQNAFKLDQTFVELWLLRGQIGLERKGQADGNYYFQRAVALRRDDPRVYRIVLDSLIKQNEFPKGLVAEYLRDLVKRTVSNDERSWVSAADAAVCIGEIENANEYLSHVVEPYLQERKKQIVSRIEDLKGK